MTVSAFPAAVRAFAKRRPRGANAGLSSGVCSFLLAYALSTLPMVGAPAQIPDTVPHVSSADTTTVWRPYAAAHSTVFRVCIVDSASIQRIWPYVLGGGMVGAALGTVAYRKWARRSNDGDFGGPFSTIVTVGSASAVGALGGFLISRLFRHQADPRRGARRRVDGYGP